MSDVTIPEAAKRDIYEVANQLQGYVGPGTDEALAAFLMKEGGEAAKLADEIVRLQTALYRIALKDRHYRVHKPKPDGGFRGVGGMIATFALTGVNGSYIGDAAISEQFPHIAAALSQPNDEGEGK